MKINSNKSARVSAQAPSFATVVKSVATYGLLAASGGYARATIPAHAPAPSPLRGLDLPPDISIVAKSPVSSLGADALSPYVSPAPAPALGRVLRLNTSDSAHPYDKFCAALKAWSSWLRLNNQDDPECLTSSNTEVTQAGNNTVGFLHELTEEKLTDCQSKGFHGNEDVTIDGPYNHTRTSVAYSPGYFAQSEGFKGSLNFSGAVLGPCEVNYAFIYGPEVTSLGDSAPSMIQGNNGQFCGIDVDSLDVVLSTENGSSEDEALESSASLLFCLENS